jgi:hypothetical protein
MGHLLSEIRSVAGSDDVKTVLAGSLSKPAQSGRPMPIREVPCFLKPIPCKRGENSLMRLEQGMHNHVTNHLFYLLFHGRLMRTEANWALFSEISLQISLL